MLFLVQGHVVHTPYGGSSKTEKVMRIVIATDADDATRKFEKAFADQTVEYADYYTGFVDDVSPAIE